MKKKIFIIYENDEKIGMFEDEKKAKQYVEYLDFYNCSDTNKYYYRKEYIYV